jgi:hypothetical protein
LLLHHLVLLLRGGDGRAGALGRLSSGRPADGDGGRTQAATSWAANGDEEELNVTADSMHRQSEAYAHRAAPEHSGDGEILAALPLQVIELPDGVVLKRGATEFAVTGPGAVSAVRRIFTMIVEGGATRANLLARIHAGSGKRSPTCWTGCWRVAWSCRPP